MAYAFPLAAAQFMALLPIREIGFDIGEAMEVSETGGGEVLTADLGPRLWRGRVALADMLPDEAADVLPLIDILRRTGASFMAYDAARPGPRLDIAGTVLGSATPTLSQVNANMREIRLAGLPPGYRLRPYDYLAFSYGANPTRFALHRGVNAISANSQGGTGWWEVTPNIRPGFAIGAAVTLVRAACKAVIVPGSTQPGQRRAAMLSGVSFDFIQTLR